MKGAHHESSDPLHSPRWGSASSPARFAVRHLRGKNEPRCQRGGVSPGYQTAQASRRVDLRGGQYLVLKRHWKCEDDRARRRWFWRSGDALWAKLAWTASGTSHTGSKRAASTGAYCCQLLPGLPASSPLWKYRWLLAVSSHERGRCRASVRRPRCHCRVRTAPAHLWNRLAYSAFTLGDKQNTI